VRKPTSEGVAGSHFNAAVAAFRRGDYGSAVRHYREGLDHAPRSVPAYLDLAKAHENLGEWDAALRAVDQGLELAPGNPTGLRRRARIVEQKATFDAISERLNDPSCDAFQHCFTLTVGPGVPPRIHDLALRALSQAYWEFGKALEVFPSEPVVVHLLPSRAGIRHGWPPWAAGIAQDNGTILVFLHSPAPGPGLLAGLLRHEYAHLLIMASSAGRCPHWLQEAIAECLAKPRMAWEEARLSQAVQEQRTIRLRDLTDSFTQLRHSDVGLAYHQCARIGEFLVDSFGIEAIRAALRSLHDGATIDDALRTAFDVDVDELDALLFTPTASEPPGSVAEASA